MTLASSSLPLSGLAKRLIKAGLLTEDNARDVQKKAHAAKQSFTHYVTKNKLVAENALAVACSEEFGSPMFDLTAFDKEVMPVDVISEKLIEKHGIIPLMKRGNKLFIATSDPTHLQAFDEIKFQTSHAVEPIIVEETKLAKLIEFALNRSSADDMGGLEEEAGLEAINVSADGDSDDITKVDAEDAPIIRFVNKMILNAINSGASDIHFEPYEKIYRVRYRQDGVLQEVSSPPISQAPKIAARLKIMSRLDISEKRIPQDGRFKMRISKSRAIDFRVSVCPTLFGEKAVLRILDPSSAQLGIDKLGYEKKQKELFLNAIAQPQGMVLVTGPTGSGKTVSLYTALNILNTSERNISTAEDPVEINLAGINQVQMNNKAGLNFAAALRSFLRQDPDIVMVGEIRDLETAEIAVKAAQTGHLVLSTLHTNSAPETLTRLVNMGVPAFNIATSVTLIIAQRLARKLCPDCKIEDEVPEKAQIQAGFREEEIGKVTFYRPNGCDLCVRGYKGRLGIYEVMPITDGIGRVIMDGGNAIQIADQAKKEGLQDLRRSGLNRIIEGVTSLEEINRVTND